MEDRKYTVLILWKKNISKVQLKTILDDSKSGDWDCLVNQNFTLCQTGELQLGLCELGLLKLLL